MRTPITRAKADFFACRTPFLPFDTFERWSSTLAVSTATPSSLDDALAADRVRLRAELRAAFDRPDLREALFVASPALAGRIGVWIDNPHSREGQKIERALTRYFSRMCTRSTPFGLFAACSVGTIGDTTRLSLSVSRSDRRHIRLHCDYVTAVVDALIRDPLWQELRYVPNGNMSRKAGRLLYTMTLVRDGALAFREESAELDDVLERVLALAENGIQAQELMAQLADELPNATADEIAGYVRALVDAQVLEPEIALRITGAEPAARLIAELSGTAGGRIIAMTLGDVQEALIELESSPEAVHPDGYRALATALSSVPGATPIDRMFQVDLVRHFDRAELDQALLNEILVGVEVLRRLADAHDPLSDFKQQFLERFGLTEVPFLEVIATDFDFWNTIGSTFAEDPNSPLIGDLQFPTPPKHVSIAWGKREERLLKLIATAGGHSGQVPLELDTLEAFADGALPLPNAFSVVASLIGSAETIAAGQGLIHLQGFAGPSGAKFLGRFCHADLDLHEHVQSHLREEEALDPGCVFAEVVHQPAGRLGNILLRPAFRQYEITYLGKSGAPRASQIPAADLLLSVVDDRVVLRSRKLDQPILPSMTNAMSLGQCPAAYTLLSRIATQGVCANGAFSWSPFDALKSLPRVVTGRIVLSPARWTLEADDLKDLQHKSGAELFRAAARLREQSGLPRRVLLADGDASLLVDFDNVLSLESFAHLVRRRGRIRLTEPFISAEQLCASGPTGRFAHELVIPLIREQPVPAVPNRRVAAAVNGRTSVKFLPGGDWFYAKVYGPAAMLDRIASAVVPPLLAPLRAEGLVARWFFIRFADPAWHLRVRLLGTSPALNPRALAALQTILEPLCARGLVQELELATYEPEVSRYGGDHGLVLAEQMFALDSEVAIEMIQAAIAEDWPPDWRWQLALCGADQTLGDFGLPLEERHRLVSATYFGLLHETQKSSSAQGASILSRQLGTKFRGLRSAIEGLLRGNAAPAHLASGIEALQRRSVAAMPVAQEVQRLVKHGGLGVTLHDWLRSILHMSANRLIPSNSLQHELVLADFLRRFYKSSIAVGAVDAR